MVAILGFLHAAFATEGLSAPNEAKRLVYQLGDQSFLLRSQAEQQLLNLGYGSYRAILEGAESTEPEIRFRAQRLLKLLQREAFANQKHQLRLNPWLVPEELAPGWEVFQQLLGDGLDARELYIQIINGETELILELTRPNWQLAFEKRCADLLAFSNQRRQVELPPGTIAALLFLACHPENQPSNSASSVIYMLLSDEQFRDAATRSRSSDVLKALIGHWIRKSENSSSMRRLSDAAAFEIDAAMEIARDTIATRNRLNTASIHLENSIFYLAKHGGDSVIEELEELLNEKLQLQGSPRESEMDVQIRDVALAALLYVTNQDPIKYGFHGLRNKKGYLYIGSSAKFTSPQQREAAMQLWQDWRQENVRDPVPEGLDASYGELL